MPIAADADRVDHLVIAATIGAGPRRLPDARRARRRSRPAVRDGLPIDDSPATGVRNGPLALVRCH